MFRLILLILAGVAAMGCRGEKNLHQQLMDYVAMHGDAQISVAVVAPAVEPVAVNADSALPMMSVVKFPQALAVIDWLEVNGLSVADSIDIPAEELHEDTWSPMREKYGRRPLRLTYGELLMWSLTRSDNNACDVLFRAVGGTDAVRRWAGEHWPLSGIRIEVTEDEMHADPMTSYRNSATTLDVARLFLEFHRRLRSEAETSEGLRFVASQLEQCDTGRDRLAAPLSATDARLGHKTGSGFTLPDGRLMATNDAGYVELPDGRCYAIAVFVTDSAYGEKETSAIIADVSKIVYEHFTN